MSPYVLEIPDGSDIVEAISRFCSSRNTGLNILHVYGSVADVTLRQSPSLTFRGRFQILSASATFLPPRSTSSSFSVPDGLIITLAGPQGQVIGGFVAGTLISSGIVYVIASSFNNPSYHRLPSEDLGFSDVEEDQSPPISGKNATAFDFRGMLPSYCSHCDAEEDQSPPISGNNAAAFDFRGLLPSYRSRCDVEEDQSPPISGKNATAFDFRGLYRSHSAFDII